MIMVLTFVVCLFNHPQPNYYPQMPYQWAPSQLPQVCVAVFTPIGIIVGELGFGSTWRPSLTS